MHFLKSQISKKYIKNVFKISKKNTWLTKYLNVPLKNTVIPQYLWATSSRMPCGYHNPQMFESVI